MKSIFFIVSITLLVMSASPAFAAVSESETKRDSIATDLAKGNDDKAMKDLKDVITSNKFQDIKEWATLELFNKAQSKGKLDEVTADLEKSAAKNPNDVLMQRAVAEGYLRMRDFGKAVTIYEELVKNNPKDFVLSTRLNDYYILAGDYGKAIASLEPIVAAAPDDDYHSDILLNAYVRGGMEDKALALFKKRLAKEPNSPGLRARYAQALQDFGKRNEAVKEWDRAFQLDPNNQFFKRRADEVRADIANPKKGK